MKLRKCNIILPSVWSGVYYNTARLLKFSFLDIGYNCQIIEAGQDLKADLSIVLGWNLISDSQKINDPYIIYQLEPLCLEHWRKKLETKNHLFRNAHSIWDYTISNQKYLNEFGLKSVIIPLGYHHKIKEVNHLEYADYDVLFIGFLTERRHSIIKELNQHCCVSIQPRWGNDFSEALGRSKILLNIHQYDAPTPLEQPRIAYALNNNCFVLSEEGSDEPYYDLTTCRYEKMVSQILHYLRHVKLRNEVKDKVFSSFKKFSMKDLILRAMQNYDTEI